MQLPSPTILALAVVLGVPGALQDVASKSQDDGPEKDPGEWTVIYHESGKKAREGRIWKGRRHGMWKAWYGNGELRYEGRIEDYQRVGVWKNYFESGKLRSEGLIAGGRPSGPWKVWFANGQLSTASRS